MKLDSLVSAVHIGLALQTVWAGSGLLHAQRALAHAPLDVPRAVFLENLATASLTIGPSGAVLLASSGPSFVAGPSLTSVGLHGSVRVRQLNDLMPFSNLGQAHAISRDGSLVATASPPIPCTSRGPGGP